ncbi:PAS domain S-box protein [Rosistilla oblonga]|uniref:Sensory/regulatory protein RpfC n=1 Tax=Rosistilla oblonga TaxID=2527990 RepID=A0A518IPL1_9BACT|nr:PAS domain S-box protein [Rosistilla oblonga]QDV55012.1 Signal transduction histidine-protein kinase BarA [Rosistilla oblonga]
MRSRKRFMSLVAGGTLALAVPLCGAMLAQRMFPESRFQHLPLHSLLEATGGLIAIAIASILIVERARRENNRHYPVMAAALISMGVLDLFQAGVAVGDNFIWLHSVGTCLGGVVFALVWYRTWLQKHGARWMPSIALAASVSLGTLSCLFASSLPTMIWADQFTLAPRLLNGIGGLGFLVACGFFVRRFYLAARYEDWLFLSCTLMLGTAAILFGLSTLWDATWWWWHLLRIFAYAAALAYAMQVFFRTETELIQLNRQLVVSNKTLDESVRSTTADLHVAHRELAKHQHLLSTLVENIPDPVFFKDLEGRFFRANQAMASSCGLESPEAMLGKTDADIWTTDFAQQTDVDEQAIIRSGKPLINKEELLVRPDGRQRWVLVTKMPLKDESGNVVGTCGIARDITERKHQEERISRINHQLEHLNEELLTSEKRYRGLVDHSPEAILMLDLDSQLFVDGNDSALKIFGISREQLLRSRPNDLSPPLQPDGKTSDEKAHEYIRQAYAEGVAVFDWVHQRIDGGLVECEVRLVSHPDRNRRMIRASVIDNSWRKSLERELRSARDQAERSSRAKSEFLANMSHEIRTPLNAVIGLTEAVLRTELSESQRDHLSTVVDSAESLLSVINDILDFSKIEAGHLQMEHADFNLRDLLDDTLKSLALRAEHRGNVMLCDCDADVPATLVGDPLRLRQVMTNLLNNAIKFTERGEILVRVGVAKRIGDDRVRLHVVVKDSGIGIQPDQMDRLFEAFEQADSSTTRQYGGTGLGLSICAQLVKLMEGKIWAESDSQHGSEFHFEAEFGVASGEPQVLPDGDLLVGVGVLVVEPNPTNRAILEQMLVAKQMSPVAVASIPEALEVIDRSPATPHPIRVALLDDHVGDPQSLLQVAGDGKTRLPIRVVVMGVVEGQRDATAGAAAWLTKPVKQSELFQVLCKVLQSDRPRVTAVPVAATPEIVLPPLDILLVEDSVVNRTVAIAILRGHRVEIAENGRQALEQLERRAFDVVLMDVQMPEMDGYEATAAIRRREQGTDRHQYIIAMTAHAIQGDRELCLAAGMDDYVSKPVRRETLIAAIAKANP